MTAAQWAQFINDSALGWASVFRNNEQPITAAQTQAAVYLETQRQNNNTLLLLGIAAVVVFAISKSR